MLNESLAIPSDQQGRLEVDLLCADVRVAVELDGVEHLGDPEAYSRDRRKDQLLQEHGYFVLRFLAEDVGKCRHHPPVPLSEACCRSPLKPPIDAASRVGSVTSSYTAAAR